MCLLRVSLCYCTCMYLCINVRIFLIENAISHAKMIKNTNDGAYFNKNYIQEQLGEIRYFLERRGKNLRRKVLLCELCDGNFLLLQLIIKV